MQRYTETLGFTLNSDNPIGEGMRWVQVTPPGGGVGVALITWNADVFPPGALKELYLNCDNIAETVAALQERGVAVTQPVFDTPFGRFARFTDPDGNGWHLHEGPQQATATPEVRKTTRPVPPRSSAPVMAPTPALQWRAGRPAADRLVVGAADWPRPLTLKSAAAFLTRMRFPATTRVPLAGVAPARAVVGQVLQPRVRVGHSPVS